MTFFFETCVVERGLDGIVTIALIDHGLLNDEHTLIVRCGESTAVALVFALETVLQRDDDA